MAAEVIPSRLAVDVLARVLCSERSDADANRSRLREITNDRATVLALLPSLTDIELHEWTGDSGTRYREYIGRLPCGLTLVVQTDAELVPLVELPEGGGSDG